MARDGSDNSYRRGLDEALTLFGSDHSHLPKFVHIILQRLLTMRYKEKWYISL